MSTRLGIAVSILAFHFGGWWLLVPWLLVWWRINDIVEETGGPS